MHTNEARDDTHRALINTIRTGPGLESLLSRGDQRRLVREVSEWYLDSHGRATHNGSCVVVTAGPPGAGKSSLLTSAIPDVADRLVIDPDIAKAYLAQWCVNHDLYGELLSTGLPDGGTIKQLELSPLLQTMSTESCNTVRRLALAAHTDVVVETTMASPAFGERLLLSLAKADYDKLVIVSVEVDRDTAQSRAVDRWWQGRQENLDQGGRLVLPETIEAAYPPDGRSSLCRQNARALVNTIRAGGTVIDTVTIAEYDDRALTRLDADRPRTVGQPSPPTPGDGTQHQ
ncbi:MAG: zeta toxin family protein [Actinobacteria bacterium]|nr:zeta toxin family protein [Actinomycetota bacterium]